jgi:PTH1 family peptidyl-tRNA hydrolase
MLLVVGLGNPGPGYARHRHNIGYMAVDEIAHRHGFAPFRARFEGLVAEGKIDGTRAICLKPTTYMNASGRSVAAAARYYKLPLERIVVIHDEVDLSPGRIKVKRGGGSAGHNGLRSIDDHLGADYWRVRLGVGHPGHKDLVADYVLHDFAKVDRAWLVPLLDAVAEHFPQLARGQTAAFLNQVARALKPPKPKSAPGEAPAS